MWQEITSLDSYREAVGKTSQLEKYPSLVSCSWQSLLRIGGMSVWWWACLFQNFRIAVFKELPHRSPPLVANILTMSISYCNPWNSPTIHQGLPKLPQHVPGTCTQHLGFLHLGRIRWNTSASINGHAATVFKFAARGTAIFQWRAYHIMKYLL